MAVRAIDGTWSKFVWNLGESSESLGRKFREGKACLRDLKLAVDAQPTLTTPNRWVSVEERLPDPDFPGQQRGFYLVALSNGTVKELMYEFRHYENMMFDVGWHETAFPVTHWMLLPAPPDRRPPEGEA